jgi:hypothetical protein
VLAALNEWAAAWSRKDAQAYLAHYAPDFKVPGAGPRARWEALRRSRIQKPRTIELEIIEPVVLSNGPEGASVVFRQHYRSDTLDEWDDKTVVFTRVGARWLILEERVKK